MRITLSRVLAANDPVLRRLMSEPDEPFSRWFVEAHSPLARKTLEARLAAAPAPPDRERQKLRQDLDPPGGDVYHVLRKRFVEDEVRASLEDGAEQVALLGAGYDTLCLRLSRDFPAVRFFELDHPDTLAVKRRALESHSALPPALTLLPVDLVGQSAEQALAAAGFRPGARSCFVAEGLLPFLPPDVVDGVFASVRRQVAPGSRFVFTLVDAAQLDDATSDIARIAKFCALWSEPICSSHDRGGLGDYLAARGFRCRAQADSPELKRRYLDPLGLDRPVGVREFLVVAEAV